MLAYLVIREGTKWTDVFRLIPGRTVTIGRAATNQIVIKDERCSRNHAEIFVTHGHWTLRDLDSRNGTTIGRQQIRGDYTLKPGDVIRIAHCQLAFVHDLDKAFRDAPSDSSVVKKSTETQLARTDVDITSSDSNVLDGFEPTTITHRKEKTKYLEPSPVDVSIPKAGLAATILFRLAFRLGRQQDFESAVKLALDGLFEGARVNAGAVLLAPRDSLEQPDESQLELVASRADSGKYHRISSFLATTVLREGEAVLARNIEDDSMLGSRDSKGVIHSTSVIGAPIRQKGRVVGLVHLYTTSAELVPDPDDLEFTLAVAEYLALALSNLTRSQELAENLTTTEAEVRQLREQLGAECEIVADSDGMAKVQQQIARAAPSRATVLIHGESGVGKELVARAMHFASPRRNGPFVCLNCAALSESLLESELFGHEKGAFTGATDRKIGKFEAADGGTLMLDEIGEMSPSIQAKFLRVLEGHPFERVGGSQAIKVDVRVVAATNRDLERAVADGTFRRDLYFRLNVLEIFVPPLRKRPEDVLAIAKHFLDRFNKETGRKLDGFDPGALDLLYDYHWPGNVRELKNVVERAVVLARGDEITADDLVLSNLASATDTSEIKLPITAYEPMSLAEVEKIHIARTLESTGWNKSRAASILRIERSTLDRKIRRYELKQKVVS